MDFEDICQIVDTVVDLPVHSKRALLHDLAHRAALVLKVDDDTVFSALLKREELGSTGVGNGVALPHVRLEQVKKPFGIMARLKQPIDFDAIDGQRVDLVCLLLLSKENEQAQLNVLPPSPENFERRNCSSSCAARPIAWCSITSWSEEPACTDPSETIFNA